VPSLYTPPRSYSRNGLGIVYSRRDGRFVTDLPTRAVPACEAKAFPLDAAGLEGVRAGRF